MKIGEAQSIYREQRQTLTEQRRALIKRRDELQKRMEVTENGKELFAKDAAVLELSIKETNDKFDKNQKVLDALTEQYAAVWNAEVARQQSDVMEEAAVDLAKIMEVARRIAKGGRVPAQDEQKLMDYSMEMYMAAKNLAIMNAEKEHKKYKSLWEDEEENEQEYDPQGKAENAEVNIDLPEIDVSVSVSASDSGAGEN